MNLDGSAIHRSRSLFYSAILLSATLSLCSLTSGCGKEQAANQQAPGGGAVGVKIQVAKSVKVEDSSEYVATLKSRDSAVIMPQVEGQITAINVHSGDRVSPGQPLMQIDPARQQATVKTQEDTLTAKQADVEYAKQEYERTSGLYKAGVVSKQALDQAKSALDSAQAQLQALSAQVRQETVQLHYYRVTAPTSGIVGDIPVRVGDRVNTSTQLTTVDKPGSLEAYVYVPLEKAPQLKMGLPVEILDGEENVAEKSKITFISPQVDNTTQTILVKARLTNNRDRLRNAQFIRARVIWGTHDGPVVPVLAVSRIGGQYFAFVAEDQNGKLVAHQKALKVGQIVDNNYVVLDGIQAGDKVIVSGTQFLVDGAPVRPEG